MSNTDLTQWITSELDFYELLGLQFETFSEPELRRAYRKTALRYHPDKLGKDFDANKYEQFQAANEILGDPDLKAKYDNTRNARLQKQRANELFEGRRRQMKEDLEARERGGTSTAGTKRARDDEPSEMQQEIRRLAEEGRKRRAARASMMAENIQANMAPSPAATPILPTTMTQQPTPSSQDPAAEEDEVERLERRLREAEQAKARRKAEKKARKSGVFVPVDSPTVGAGEANGTPGERESTIPIKRPDLFERVKADERSSATPISSPRNPKTPSSTDFAATMARLKAAKEQRMAQEAAEQQARSSTWRRLH